MLFSEYSSMLRRLLSALIFMTLTACSSGQKLGARFPASSDGGCESLIKDLVSTEHTPLFKLSDFSDLETDFIDQDETLKSLVELHQSSINREQSRIALALLREKNPDFSPRELAREYTRLLNDCHY